jgi:hypothetical protein
MKIRLEEYTGCTRVRLAVDDAPMTAVRGLVEAFTRALDEVKDRQSEEPSTSPGAFVFDMTGKTTTFYGDIGAEPDLAPFEPEPAAADAPKKRGRPKKADAPATAEVEMLAETQPNREAMAENMHGAVEQLPPAAEEPAVGAPPLGLSTASETASESASTSEMVEDPKDSTSGSTDDLPDAEVTDSELQRFCAKLAQHFGTPQTVFDLAGKFTPEGAVARPTNIRDNNARWAFIRAAEAQSGLRFHG